MRFLTLFVCFHVKTIHVSSGKEFLPCFFMAHLVHMLSFRVVIYFFATFSLYGLFQNVFTRSGLTTRSSVSNVEQRGSHFKGALLTLFLLSAMHVRKILFSTSSCLDMLYLWLHITPSLIRPALIQNIRARWSSYKNVAVQILVANSSSTDIGIDWNIGTDSTLSWLPELLENSSWFNSC
jgi:hypothetical protein